MERTVRSADFVELLRLALTFFVLCCAASRIMGECRPPRPTEYPHHHRRLMRQPYGSRPVVFINLFFLLSIILLPITSGLDGNYGQSSVIAVLYGLHLITIAALNAWLWWIATRDRRSRHELRRAFFPLLPLLLGTLVAAFAPQYSRYFWLLAFGGVLFRGSAPAADEVGR
jgi:hypothetical protein